MRTAVINLRALAFLVLFLWLSVVAWRRFGAVYGLYCLVSLAIPLSVAEQQVAAALDAPLRPRRSSRSSSRSPSIGGRPRVHTAILAVSAILLGVAVSQWALWQWVA